MFQKVFPVFNEIEDLDPKRTRIIKDGRYLSLGLVNAYLDERLKPADKKKFEALVRNLDELKEELRKKSQKKEFINELVPHPQLLKSNLNHLKVELSDITETIIGDDKISVTGKIAKFFDKTIFEF